MGKLCEMSNIPRRKDRAPNTWKYCGFYLEKNPITELTFNLPFRGEMTVNVNVVGVMDDSHFLVCHTEPVCGI